MDISSFFKSSAINWVIGSLYRFVRNDQKNDDKAPPMDLPGHVVLEFTGGSVANAAVLSIETENDKPSDRPIVAGPGPLVLEFTGDWPKTDNAENAYISVGDGGGCLLSINGRCIIAGRKLTVE